MTVPTQGEVRRILEDPFAENRVWTLQGLGMLRTYLSSDERVRLHIWNEEMAVPDVSTVHDHPWDFTSTLISGTLYNTRFTPASVGQNDTECFWTQGLVCGVGGHLIGGPEVTWLQRVDMETYGAGERYAMEALELHESGSSPGAVSVIERTFRNDRDRAKVAWKYGSWVSAEPRVAIDDEVVVMTSLALQHWTTS